MTKHKIEVRRLPRGEFTNDGAFWPIVNGENVGENDRCHWHTEAEARAVAERYAAVVNRQRRSDRWKTF